MRKLLTVAVLLLPLAAAAQYEPAAEPAPDYAPAPAQPGYAPTRQAPYGQPSYGQPLAVPGARRSPWYIGFGFGTGNGSEKYSSGTVTFQEDHESAWGMSVDPTNVTLNFKIGATLTPNLLVGFDLTAIRSQYDDSGSSTAIQVNNYDAVATWFPMGEGLFLRGGAGLSKIVWSVDTPYGDASNSEDGFNVLVGGGYAFWLGQTFNLTLNVDYSTQSYSSDVIDSSNFWNLWVGFDWY